nr:MAG TPA: hypothetical protein [Caudoviricetes sp.]
MIAHPSVRSCLDAPHWWRIKTAMPSLARWSRARRGIAGCARR